jgi:uncharacterized protein YndB with AHSA1/START domain
MSTTPSTPVVVEQKFSASLQRLWRAITEKEELPRWFFENIPDFEAIVGFTTEFEVKSEERTFTHQWKIMEVIPEKKISYQWKYKEYEGESLVVFEIEEMTEGSLLRVSNFGLENFPQNIPEFHRSSCHAGWTYFISERLGNYLKV